MKEEDIVQACRRLLYYSSKFISSKIERRITLLFH